MYKIHKMHKMHEMRNKKTYRFTCVLFRATYTCDPFTHKMYNKTDRRMPVFRNEGVPTRATEAPGSILTNCNHERCCAGRERTAATATTPRPPRYHPRQHGVPGMLLPPPPPHHLHLQRDVYATNDTTKAAGCCHCYYSLPPQACCSHLIR